MLPECPWSITPASGGVNRAAPGTVRRLAQLPSDGGRLAIRKPLNFISRDEIRGLMAASGLVERAGRHTEVKTQGQVYEGIYAAA